MWHFQKLVNKPVTTIDMSCDSVVTVIVIIINIIIIFIINVIN